ncbi:MAG TPA: L,D-transpeptidase [Kiritimatiellia bacterium]|nr:L,D-transpeptidase [Kiritimatiellia bacterium]HMO99071.1 L,D-transpeptidase [Kiritimatiellia bacterium]HMP97136.1 L,D-transpeptidase [Kiritimatiellia bacterium]
MNLGSEREAAVRLGMPPDAWLLVVHVENQELIAGVPGSGPLRYPVSTSRLGLGERKDSWRTPRGYHEIVERLGDGLPVGAVLVSRTFTGEVLPSSVWRDEHDGDKILSRILRLAGREPGRNAGGEVDSYDRLIYLHGTNHEQWVGVAPSSHGCIRMKNNDIIDLFDRLRGRAAWVLVCDDAPPPSL